MSNSVKNETLTYGKENLVLKIVNVGASNKNIFF